MLVIVNIVLCLLNVAMAYNNYEQEKYKSAMFSAFAAGVTAMSACAIALINVS